MSFPNNIIRFPGKPGASKAELHPATFATPENQVDTLRGIAAERKSVVDISSGRVAYMGQSVLGMQPPAQHMGGEQFKAPQKNYQYVPQEQLRPSTVAMAGTVQPQPPTATGTEFIDDTPELAHAQVDPAYRPSTIAEDEPAPLSDQPAAQATPYSVYDVRDDATEAGPYVPPGVEYAERLQRDTQNDTMSQHMSPAETPQSPPVLDLSSIRAEIAAVMEGRR